MSWRAACDCAGGSGPQLGNAGAPSAEGMEMLSSSAAGGGAGAPCSMVRSDACSQVSKPSRLLSTSDWTVRSSCGSDCADSVPGGAGGRGASPTCSLLTAEWRRLAMAMRFPVVTRFRLLRCSLRTSTDMEHMAAMVSVERSSEDWSGRAARGQRAGTARARERVMVFGMAPSVRCNCGRRVEE